MLLSEISLYAATREQTTVSWKRTAAEWGKGLTLEEYLLREFIGEKQEFARDGKIITWVLAPRNDSTTLDFLCSCKTFKREIVISRPLDPSPVKGYGYAVGCVLTPVCNRGKGYARHMMRLLHWVLASEAYLSTQVYPEAEWGPRPLRLANAGDASMAALWSAVGTEFYKGCGVGVGVEKGDGWEVRDPVSTIWNVGEGDGGYKGKGIWLDLQKARDVWEEDGEMIKAEVIQVSKTTGQTQFSFLPGAGVAEFQWFRQNYHFSLYVPDPPKFCGVQIDSGRGYASWTCEFRPGLHRKLIITRLRASEETIEGLLRLVLGYAKAHGLEVVEAWNLPENLSKTLDSLGGRTVERCDQCPAIKWYGSEEKVGWMTNERFWWC